MRELLVPAVLAAGLSVPASAAAAEKNIAETAAADPRFDTLVALVQQAGRTDELSGDAKLTVFAPTDAAFKRVLPPAR
jgi:uncharacterized surface protein with fasciclin (FAS1) repeats